MPNGKYWSVVIWADMSFFHMPSRDCSKFRFNRGMLRPSCVSKRTAFRGVQCRCVAGLAKVKLTDNEVGHLALLNKGWFHLLRPGPVVEELEWRGYQYTDLINPYHGGTFLDSKDVQLVPGAHARGKLRLLRAVSLANLTKKGYSKNKCVKYFLH